jgi:TPR repeat protein
MIAMWLDRAEGGDAFAQYQLGWCFEMGEGVRRDLESACRWYLRAARQGQARAQYHYGLACSNGVPGVPWNRVEACKWLTLAAKGGIKEAVSALEVFKLPPEERTEGTLAAKRFIPEPEAQIRPAGQPERQAPNSLPMQSTQLGFPF